MSYTNLMVIKMKTTKRVLYVLFILLILSVVWGRDCIDGVEVELWGECYDIEETTELDLSVSGLTGGIPPEIGNLTNLTDLSLSSNQLTGEVPPEIGNLPNLTWLSLGWNQLTGEVPQEIGNLVNLEILSLSSNQLTGEVPEEICSLAGSYLSLYNNQLCPPYPGCLDLSDIGEQDTSECEDFECDDGFVELWNFCFDIETTTELHLSNSGLTGEVPPEICNLSGIVLSLSNNQLCPPYPECLSEYDIGEQDTTNCSSTSISELSLPIEYNLHQPFPNPFNPTTTISFTIPNSDMVSVKVYNINGQLVETMVDEYYNVGEYTINWNGNSQPSGVYLVRMESGEFVQTQKVILLK